MNVIPRKGLSQVFLVNEHYLKKIAALILPAERIIEIGPGRGELTKYLLEKTDRLILVEIDSRLVALLKKQYALDNRVQLLHADILTVPLENHAAVDTPISIAGNLPYHLSFKLIEYFVQYRSRITSIYAMFQKEFAQKLAARPGTKEYCFITCFFQYYFRITAQITIPASAFSPQPKIDSLFVKIERASNENLTKTEETRMMRLIRQAFMYRRKKITNALGPYIERSDFEELLAKASINAGDRPDAVSLKQYLALAKLLQKE